MDDRQLDRDITGAAAAHQRLLARLDALAELDPQRPSLLPDWTVGHVLTHIARNADSIIRMLDGLDRTRVGIVVECRIEPGPGVVRYSSPTSVARFGGSTALGARAAWTVHRRGDGGLSATHALPARRLREPR